MSADVVLALATFASASLVAGSATWALARKRIRVAEDRAATLARGLATQRDVAERRVREVRAELAKIEATSLARHKIVPERLYLNRLAPRDADALASALGGLAFVDAALVADASGYALSRGTGDASSALSQPATALSSTAAAVATLARELSLASVTVLEAHVETADARHVTTRVLRGRGEGAFVVAATTSRPVSAIALDAVAQHAVAHHDPDLVPVPASASGIRLRGATEKRAVRDTPLSPLWDELEREHAEHADLRALVLGVDSAAVFSAAKDGPDDDARARTLRALKTFADRVASRFRDTYLTRIDVQLEGGDVLCWAPLASRSRLCLVVLGDVAATAPERVERLAGRLRRKIAEGSAPSVEGGAR